MGLFDFLRGKPTEDSYARDLIAAAGREGFRGWRHVPAERVIVGPNDSRLSLINVFLEYRQAPAADRPALLAKTLQMMTNLQREVPKLWNLAQKSIYPVLRSRHDYLSVEIEMRDKDFRFPARAELPFHGDLVIRIAYDFGPSVSQVTNEQVETWGVGLDAVYQRALQNLRALEKPMWVSRVPGVMQLVSNASYEESMLLRPDVPAALSLRGELLVMAANRGVLLATGSEEPGGVKALLAAARDTQFNNPWPLSPALLRWSNGAFVLAEPPAPFDDAMNMLRVADLTSTYADQKTALEKWLQRTGRDIFVATHNVMVNRDVPDKAVSTANWTEDVQHTWLPKCDQLLIHKTLDGQRFQVAFVAWDKVAQICGTMVRPLEETPPRYEVTAFPDDAQWRDLVAAAEWVREVTADGS